MTTPNIVPRGNGEGGIGTNEKFWKNGYFENLQTRGGTVATESYVQQKTEEHNSATSVHTANLASKAEAEAGTDTSKFMTPARVSDAIKTFAGAYLTGMIFAFAGNTIPSGYLACNGAAVSRTTYANLFDVIGTTYGIGDGSTTFNLPNLENNSFMEFSGTVGTAKSAGLPNITGGVPTMAYRDASNWDTESGVYGEIWSGALLAKKWEVSYTYFTNRSTGSIVIDGAIAINASKNNPIYGNSNTVQPKSLTIRAIIKY